MRGVRVVVTIIGPPAAAEISCRSAATARRGGGDAERGAVGRSHAPCCARNASAIVTSMIIRSYDSRAESPNEKIPCCISTMPTVDVDACSANSTAQRRASANPGMT